MFVQRDHSRLVNAQVVQQNSGMARILSCDHLNTRKDLCGSDGNVPEVADRCRHHVQGALLRRLRFTFDHLIRSLEYRPTAITVQEIEVLRYTEPMRVHPAVRPALIVLLALFVMLITGCVRINNPAGVSAAPDISNKTAPSAPAQSPTPGKLVPVERSLAQKEPDTSGWTFLKRALNATGPKADANFLGAAQRFLESGFTSPASSALDNVTSNDPGSWPDNQRQLLRGALALANQKPEGALRLVERLSPDAMDSRQHLLMMELQLRAFFATGEIHQALILMRTGSAERPVPKGINPLYRLAFSQLARLSSRTLAELDADPALTAEDRAWITLASLYARDGWNLFGLRNAFSKWVTQHQQHPATNSVLTTLAPPECTSTDGAQVALLLPLSSSYREAASAFRDGFFSLHEADSDPAKPAIKVYDFGDQIELVPDYYQQALKDGASQVVGPLGRRAVTALAQWQRFPVPTLLLGSTGSGLRPGGFSLDLSLQNEARALVNHARGRGLRRALILHGSDQRSTASANAAATAWAHQGGIIAGTAKIPKGVDDYSTTLAKLLGLADSARRGEMLQALLGNSTRLYTVPRRRQDFDVIFLLSDQSIARMLKPQIDFHRASSVPVYSMNTIFSGKPNLVNDLDLEGIVFSDMPWLVRTGGRFDRTTLPFALNTPYRYSVTDRLFALGMDAYVLNRLATCMRADPQQIYAGASGLLSVGWDGRVHRTSDWVRFTDGLPQAWEPPLSPGKG